MPEREGRAPTLAADICTCLLGRDCSPAETVDLATSHSSSYRGTKMVVLKRTIVEY